MNFFFTPIPLKTWCEPLLLFTATVLLVAVVTWFGLALAEVQPGQTSVALRTGGWFYLGFPFILSLGLVIALVTTFVARKIGQLVVWVVILPLSVSFAYETGTRDLPERRLPFILGIDPQSTKVLEYRVSDSFGDGDTTIGALQPVSPEVFAAIIKDRELSIRRDMSRPDLDRDQSDVGLPTAFNDRLTVWYDAAEQRLYFRYCSRLHRGGN